MDSPLRGCSDGTPTELSLLYFEVGTGVEEAARFLSDGVFQCRGRFATCPPDTNRAGPFKREG